jgi:hypothetical protein
MELLSRAVIVKLCISLQNMDLSKNANSKQPSLTLPASKFGGFTIHLAK